MLAFAFHGDSDLTSGAERRQYARHTVNKPLLVRFGTTRQLRRTYVRDISRGGLFVRTRHPRPLRALVEIVLELPDGTRLPLTGEVVYCVSAQQTGNPATAGVGIQFLDLSTTTSYLLEEYIGLHHAESLSPLPAALAGEGTPPLAGNDLAAQTMDGTDEIPATESWIPELPERSPAPARPSTPEAKPAPVGATPATPAPTPAPRAAEPYAPVEMLLLLDTELTAFEAAAIDGTAYDALGITPTATQDGIAASYAERLAELDAGGLEAALPLRLRTRLEAARALLDGALEDLETPLRRATLDVRIGIVYPAGRSDAEMEAFKAELDRLRAESRADQQAEFVRAEKYVAGARHEASAGRVGQAHELLRVALLYDPWSFEVRRRLHELEKLVQ